jgi:hypothetical protein
MIHSFTVAFGAKYLTGMVTSVPPYETFILIKNNSPGLTRRVQLVQQKLPTLPVHLSSSQFSVAFVLIDI